MGQTWLGGSARVEVKLDVASSRWGLVSLKLQSPLRFLGFAKFIRSFNNLFRAEQTFVCVCSCKRAGWQAKNGLMKTPSIIILYVFGFAVLFGGTACDRQKKVAGIEVRPQGAQIEEASYVVVHPKARVNVEREKLRDTLSRYDSSLYLVQYFTNGEPDGAPLGTMDGDILRKGLVQTVTDEARQLNPRFTGCAIQAGSSTHQTTNVAPSTPGGPLPTPPGNSSTRNVRALMADLKPYLDKYNP